MQEFQFTGRTERLAKRRALNYWYTHRNHLGLSMTEFFNTVDFEKLMVFPRSSSNLARLRKAVQRGRRDRGRRHGHCRHVSYKSTCLPEGPSQWRDGP